MPGWRSGWPGWNGSSGLDAPVDRRLACCLPRRRSDRLPVFRDGALCASVRTVGRPSAAVRAGLSRQVFDVPPVTVRVTEYTLYKKQCRCGCVTAATPPAGVADAPVSYGPNLPAFVAYLLVSSMSRCTARRC
jgi:zinc-finger binding domain of transposase IS66